MGAEDVVENYEFSPKYGLTFRYEQTVEEPFHISKACIEPSTSKGSITSVFVEVDDADEFIICNLSEKIMNENLDLNFNSGDKICFRTTVIYLNFPNKFKNIFQLSIS